MSYFDELASEIALHAEATGQTPTESFAEVLAGLVSDAQIAFDLSVLPMTHFGPGRKPLQFLGYGEDSADDSFVLLVGKEFAEENTTLIRTDAEKIFAAGLNFLTYSLNGWIEENLEMSSPEYGFAQHFNSLFPELNRIKLILVTNGRLSDRVRTLPSGELNEIPVSYTILDIDRFEELAISSSGVDEIEIDFTRWLPEGLPCLVASPSENDIQTYLAVIPGTVLSDIFQAHGSQLLEKNVRTFLSTGGAVNRGIQTTLLNEPQRFLAYNNGITATATSVVAGKATAGTVITSLRNLQIVNGGQTTSSLAFFLKAKGKDLKDPLADVAVQMKLVTVAGDNHDDLVAAISKYANSQNKVSLVDLDSNSEFNIQLEKISRKVTAPAQGEAVHTTRWFFERARGQYKNSRAALEKRAELRQFDLRHPKSQLITKAQWAQYVGSWDRFPHQVSKGSQANFVEYSKRTATQFGGNLEHVDESFYQEGVTQAIIFRSVHKGVSTSSWYEGSYLANITTYAVAKLSHEIAERYPNRNLDFALIWQRQGLSTSLEASLLECAKLAQESLTSASRPVINVTQWAKQEAAWKVLRDLPIELPHFDERDLAGGRTTQPMATPVSEVPPATIEVAPPLSAIPEPLPSASAAETQERLASIPREVWSEVLKLGTSKRLYPVSTRGLLLSHIHNPKSAPNELQAAKLLGALDSCVLAGLVAQ